MNELRRLLPYLKRHRAMFLLGFVFVTISNIFTIIVPAIIGHTIDLINSDAYSQAQYGEVIVEVLKILLYSAIAGVFMFLTRRTIIVASRKIEYELRRDMLAKLDILPQRFFQQTSTGELMALGTNDVPAAREFIGPAIMYTANTLTRCLFALMQMLLLSPLLTLWAMLPLPLVSYVTYKIGKIVHVVFRRVQDQYAVLTSRTQENLSGARVVRSFVREDFEAKSFAALSKDYLQRNIKLVKVQALTMPLMMTLIGMSQVIVLYVGGKMVIADEATIGTLAQFFMYISILIWPVISIGWVTNIIQRGAASMGRLGKVFDATPDIKDSDKTDHSIDNLQGRIEFKNVHFRYDKQLPDVLSDISFRLEPGETLGVVGETGSGKSTLVKLLPRVFDCSKGSILIDDVNLRHIPINTLRSGIAVVPQESFLFSATIADNVRFGNPDASEEDVREACRIAQLDEDVSGFPDGYDTLVGERGITLSGGQKQRTSIARAIVRRPAIIIFDDALSAVDTNTEEKILRGLESVMKSRTSIIISHRISTVQKADKIIVIHDNHIAEFGTHDELLQAGRYYADMYQRQLLEQEIAEM